MDASTFRDNRATNGQLADLIRQIVETRNNTNMSEKVLAVLLNSQMTRFLDDIELMTALVSENNHLLKELIAKARSDQAELLNGAHGVVDQMELFRH